MISSSQEESLQPMDVRSADLQGGQISEDEYFRFLPTKLYTIPEVEEDEE